MDLDVFRRLLAPQGQVLLRFATELDPTEATFLSCHQKLRKQFADAFVKAALETAILRRKAARKFSRADRMYFPREGLKQSSGEIVSDYRARRFVDRGPVAD